MNTSSRPVLVLGVLALLLLQFYSFMFTGDSCEKKPTNSTDRLSPDMSLSTQAQAEIIDNESHDNIYRSSNLAIVTAFSENHMLEGVLMLSSLIAVHFEGPVYIFLMKEVGKKATEWIPGFKEELSKSPLLLHMIDLEVQSDSLNAGTYCFKPTAMGVFLRHNSILPSNESAQVVMWSDVSTRFLQNPSIWAKHIIEDEIDFVGRLEEWSIPQQTHRGTFDYFGFNPDDFNNHPSIAGTHFLVNLRREVFLKGVLDRWVDCGVLDCHTCMAPIGSSKRDPNGAKNGSANEYISHRQDQSVLTLLVTDYMKKKREEANVKVTRVGTNHDGEQAAPYFCLATWRGRYVKRLKDWNRTFTIPSRACKKKVAILKILSNSTITWEDEDLAT